MKTKGYALASCAVTLATVFTLSGCSSPSADKATTTDTMASSTPADKKMSQASEKDSKITGTAFKASGTVSDITQTPKPGSVPYKDAIIAARMTDVQGEGHAVPKEIVVYLWGMKDNQLAPASKIQKGDALTLTLQPWDEVESQYGGYNRVELTDPSALSLPPFWGVM
jgi:hypothetical protein